MTSTWRQLSLAGLRRKEKISKRRHRRLYSVRSLDSSSGKRDGGQSLQFQTYPKFNSFPFCWMHCLSHQTFELTHHLNSLKTSLYLKSSGHLNLIFWLMAKVTSDNIFPTFSISNLIKLQRELERRPLSMMFGWTQVLVSLLKIPKFELDT